MDKTIHMIRDPEEHAVPHSADVHPAEVENYKKAGFRPVETKNTGTQKAPAKTRKPKEQ